MIAGMETMIYLNLPQTGGETLRDILIRQYGSAGVLSFAGKAFYGDPQAAMEQTCAMAHTHPSTQVVIGHQLFGLHQGWPSPTTYVTMMRHPVERVLSQYYFNRMNHWVPDDLEAYVLGRTQYMPDQMAVDNLQTRYISAQAGLPDNTTPGACSSKMFEQAKAHLEAYFKIVGLVEAFDTSLVLMQQAFGWRPPYYAMHYRRLLKTNHQYRVDPGLVQAILDRNAWDIELYQVAQNLFEVACQRYDGDLPRDVQQFQWRNHGFGKAMALGYFAQGTLQKLLGPRSRVQA